MTENELSELRRAKLLLENPGLVAKISNVVGAPIEIALNRLPEGWRTKVHGATEKALRAALDLALRTLPATKLSAPNNRLHQIAVGVSGAVGGAFGIASLAAELPVSTTLILRSIMEIAQSEGEDLQSPEAKLACLEVFAFGGTSDLDNATESGYFAARTGLARAVGEAAAFLAKRGITDAGAPALLRLVAAIGARLEVSIAEKVAAQFVPIVGAAGGATINVLFMNHFQDMARGHFVVRRLEKKYGEDKVKTTYLRL